MTNIPPRVPMKAKRMRSSSLKPLTYGQHFARYTNRNEDGTLTGNPEISIFDNQTGIGPFLTTPTFEGAPTTLTRTFKATIDEDAKTATISDVINGTDPERKREVSYCQPLRQRAVWTATLP